MIIFFAIVSLIFFVINLLTCLHEERFNKRYKNEYLKSLDITDMYDFIQLINYDKHPKEDIYTVGELQKVYNEMREGNLL